MARTPARGVPLVAVIMGSKTDYHEFMDAAVAMLQDLDIDHEVQVVSAHRTPQRLWDFAATTFARGNQVIIAGAGGAAHLPGMTAALCPHLPVIGVPRDHGALRGVDATHSIQPMPPGVPVATMAIGKTGATNAAILAAQILGLSRPDIQSRVIAYRQKLTDDVPRTPFETTS